MRPGGQVLAVGVIDKETPIDPLTLLVREVSMIGCLAYTSAEFQMVIDLLAQGKLNIDPLLTTTIPLADIQDAGFQRLIQQTDAVQIVVSP